MNRVRMMKTIEDGGNVEEWGIYNSFKITLESNFASSEWNGCSYEIKGGWPSSSNNFANNAGNDCTPPDNTENSNGFYNCYMQFPLIYLSEQQFENGIFVDVDGQIGDYDSTFDNGPIWRYANGFNSDGGYTSADVENAGQIEMYATRTGPEGRKARHFFKATYVSAGSECSFNINDDYICPSPSFNTPPLEIQNGANGYSTYYKGNSPLIILSQHGGYLTPSNIPDRHYGCWDNNNAECIYTSNCHNQPWPKDGTNCPATTGKDEKTLELAECLRDTIAFNIKGTVLKSHLITNNLHRKKLDPNRELPEATLGNTITEVTWNEIHNVYAEEAKTAAEQQCGFGLLIDVHGQTKNDYINLGYILYGSDLDQSNNDLDGEVDGTSIRSLVTNSKYPSAIAKLSEIIRGDFGLGSLFDSNQYTVIPSQSHDSPPAGKFYGGRTFTIKRHGSRDGGTNVNDAIQIEVHEDLRTDDVLRDALCIDMSKALEEWMTYWYDMNECVSSCIRIDMNRIRVIKTNGPDPSTGYKQEWGLYNWFRITLQSNFASLGWASCSYQQSGGYPSSGFKNVNGDDCKPPVGTYNENGFYDCYMDIPPIYLSEQEFENGIFVDVDGQIGDWDYDYDNSEWVFDDGPIWRYTHGFNSNQQYTAKNIVEQGEVEMYATRTGAEGRIARHFFKATHVSGSECSFDVNKYFQCRAI